MNIDNINGKAAKMTIIGWFAGLAYYNWFSSTPIDVPLWAHAVLGVVGMFAAAIVIGGGMALLAGGITKLATGRVDGSPHAFSWAAFISPVLAFFAAKWALQFFA
ncbi:hypothetical protein CN071_27830 [Sinorhizobium meliloti]|uniref:hypothetical protein n=1 Tax=Rhizobium meliloti TaxID=382 RepID=UPI000FD82449|nr:hypothetical protein [Sinorhizobium meliloti]RVP57114.1 hypothetical protein CN071_27830 [Sinorhizobium meliloti]